MSVHIAIEGTVSAEKLTLIEKLTTLLREKGINCIVFQDPVYQWMCYGQDRDNLLDIIEQSDPMQWAFKFQLAVLTTKRNGLTTLERRFYILMKQCIEAQPNDSIPTLYEDHDLTSIEKAVMENYMEFTRHSQEHVEECTPKVLVYIEIGPEKALDNIEEKGRPEGEQVNITMEYLEKLGDTYEKCLKTNVNVIKLDGNSKDQLNPNFVAKYFGGRGYGLFY